LTLSTTACKGHSKIIEIERIKRVKNKENITGPFKKGMKRITSISCADVVFQGINMTQAFMKTGETRSNSHFNDHIRIKSKFKMGKKITIINFVNSPTQKCY